MRDWLCERACTRAHAHPVFVPSTVQLVTRKIGHEPEVTDADIANFREMEDAMAEHSKLPQDKKENAASGLPRTATQEYGWWYKEAGEYAEAVKPKKSCAETRFAGEYFRLKHTALHKERSGSLRTGGAKSAR